MCCANGDVTLTDFGIARIVAGPATHIGQPMGTPRYMAPEQWRGDSVDQRADVFAVGIILYEMLTGGPAFGTQSPSELRDRVLNEDPVAPTLVNPDLPAAIDAIVRRAIAREPGDRYPTADEFALALAPFVAGAAVAPAEGPEEVVTAERAEPQDATGVDATLPGIEPAAGAGRTIAVAFTVAMVAFVLTSIWWVRQPRRSLTMPPGFGRVEETPRAVEATASIGTTTSIAATVTAAAPSPEVAPAYREARATLADPAWTDPTKLAVIATLATDANDGATDVLVESTRNASILVSMAAVKALAGRPCARIVEPLTAVSYTHLTLPTNREV